MARPRQPCPDCGRSTAVTYRITRSGLVLMHKHRCRLGLREAFPVEVAR